MLSVCLFGLGLSANAQSRISVVPLRILNTEHMEFAPVLHGDKLVFTASSNTVLTCRHTTGEAFTDLYEATRLGDSLSNPVRMPRNLINGRYNDGVATFYSEGMRMIFTRNNHEGRNDSNFINLKLYESVREELGNWGEARPLSFNSDYYDHAHPALSADGQRLYFSSNRPGGYGGMDLWMSEWDGDKWGEPINLGPAVNTPGNEVFPFVDQEEHLFFASDSLSGRLGGLDLFVATLDETKQWQLVGPLPSPLNTPYDDFSLVVDRDFRSGYFASNRPGGAGADDLYAFHYQPQMLAGKVIVVDEATQARISDAEVIAHILDIANPLDQLYHPAANPTTFSLKVVGGEAPLDLVADATYAFTATHPDYFPKADTTYTVDLIGEEGFVIALRRRRLLRALEGVVLDKYTDQPIAGAQVVLVDQTEEMQKTYIADTLGQVFESQIDCAHRYHLKASKTGYSSDELTLEDLEPICQRVGVVKVVFHLKPQVVLSLKNVYFDFDRSDIRPDVAPMLDQLAQVMKQYPGLRLKIKAHTDSRGSDAYNLALSQRRAKSVVQYLISQGIVEDRLEWQGYGETQLVNECDDGVPCTRAQHAQNRRAELEVLKSEGVDNVDLIIE